MDTRIPVLLLFLKRELDRGAVALSDPAHHFLCIAHVLLYWSLVLSVGACRYKTTVCVVALDRRNITRPHSPSNMK